MKCTDPENGIFREKEEGKSIFVIKYVSHTLDLDRMAFEGRFNTTCFIFSHFVTTNLKNLSQLFDISQSMILSQKLHAIFYETF